MDERQPWLEPVQHEWIDWQIVRTEPQWAAATIGDTDNDKENSS
jgi:hypothetical protein